MTARRPIRAGALDASGRLQVIAYEAAGQDGVREPGFYVALRGQPVIGPFRSVEEAEEAIPNKPGAT